MLCSYTIHGRRYTSDGNCLINAHTAAQHGWCTQLVAGETIRGRLCPRLLLGARIQPDPAFAPSWFESNAQYPCSARLGSDPPPPDVSTRASKRYIRHHGAFSGQPAPAALAAADEALYMPTPAHVRYPKQVASMRKLATRTVTLLMQYNVLLLRVVQVHFTTY
jgi:hypothetical protein